jgi:hypothetical protein
MNELFALTQPQSQPQTFTHIVQFEGLPQEVSVNAIGLLLLASGVTHNAPSSDVIGSLDTGNEAWDKNNNYRYFELKNVAESLVREFSVVNCNIQAAPGYFNLVFNCI